MQEDDGVLYYSESVLHHPQCVPKKDSEIIVRGIERKYKDAVRQGEMKPYKAYKQVGSLLGVYASQSCPFFRQRLKLL